METIEELQEFLGGATQEDAWGQLLDRGTAWALMRQSGRLPKDAPALGKNIETDLAEYGFSTLRAALALIEIGGDKDLAQRAFEKAAIAFESLIKNGAEESIEKGFLRVISGAAYHLAGYSAVAYSLFIKIDENENISPAEKALMFLVLRNFDELRAHTKDFLQSEFGVDQGIAKILQAGEVEVEEAVAMIVNSTICRAMAFFDFALQTGEISLLENTVSLLERAMHLARDANIVSLWWTARLCSNLIKGLWEHSLHNNLPTKAPAESDEETYAELRELFLASLYGRKVAEVELWPSQIEAARRASDVTDDLVVALPTSAGKTRVAELAALMTLSSDKRVLIITPLRALSAQTERSFRKTFGPLGLSVSSLYGASGISSSDEDALRTKHIVIATPEKLDFALRSDSTLIDDVGLIVLDEGHMIGPTDREIRYEVLVQRLLQRSDATERRIVCLSAVLPEGEQLDDLTAWIRSDVEGSAIQSQWRPTRQRYGALVWQGASAKLSFDLDDNGPFLARFVEQVPPLGGQKKPFPRGVQDLSIFAAWKFAGQGKRTLIFVTQANWVEGFGNVAVDLVDRGYLPSLLDKSEAISRTLVIGREWLGDDHPAVKALQVGVAIHHGGLPNPFLRALEKLLAEGAIKVTVASPTLSQGLNINASTLLVPYLVRSGEEISGEELANVAGRAGRAFVDVEGLVAHVIYDTGRRGRMRKRAWRRLVDSARLRTLKSGLFQIVAEIIGRLSEGGILEREDAFEYLANSREAWKEDQPEEDIGPEPLSHFVERLDAAVFGLVEDLEADSADLLNLLDEALQGSLWARAIDREPDDFQRFIIDARAQLIWSATTPETRRGHFAMGVGLEAGLILDEMAEELAVYIDEADAAALSGDLDTLTRSLIQLAQRLLVVRPFVPDARNALPENWENILQQWVSGEEVRVVGPENMKVVEDAFSYRLVWALEALRMRRVTLGWSSDVISGGGASSLETGVPQYMMAMLIRAGLSSRKAAIKAIHEGEALFVDNAGLRAWLEGDLVTTLTSAGEWPTPETAELWRDFRKEILSGGIRKWRSQDVKRVLTKHEGGPLPSGVYRVEIDDEKGDAWVCTPDYDRLVRLMSKIRDKKPSYFSAYIEEGENHVLIRRCGRGKARWFVNRKE